VACQVLPLTRLGQGAQALDAPADKFRDWQENTNSIFWTARKGWASKWKSGSIRNRSHGREAHTRGEGSKRIYTRAPPQRVRRAFALLTKTYHGSRVTGNLPSTTRALILLETTVPTVTPFPLSLHGTLQLRSPVVELSTTWAAKSV
jgi:hypothetical protein